MSQGTRWYARTEQLLGEDGFERLRSARVAVFGLGGVGAMAVEALARAGVGHLRLVDFDVVGASNVNRQLFALHSTLGLPKVEVAARRVRDINPDCEVDVRPVFINPESLPGLLDPPVDVVVDAIDSVSSKVHLIVAARDSGAFVVSSMGAGGRLDGAMAQAGDLSESTICPLAAILRKRLRRRGVVRGLRCVWSTEPARNTLPYRAEDVGEHVGPGRARQPLGTISYMPALFGLRVAQEALSFLLVGPPAVPPEPASPRPRTRPRPRPAPPQADPIPEGD